MITNAAKKAWETRRARDPETFIERHDREIYEHYLRIEKQLNENRKV